MRLEAVRTLRSPENENRVRLCGEVSYETCKPYREIYWFEVDEREAKFLSTSGNPWLACLLPVAAVIGEPLRIGAPVDSQLYEGARELLQIWHCWYPAVHIVALEAKPGPAATEQNARRVGGFFSGGIDSFFNVLHEQENGLHTIDDLLCVGGLDIPLSNPEAQQRWQASLARAGDDLGKPLIDVATNLKYTLFGKRTFLAELSQGCALASVGLALEKKYSQLVIGSSGTYLNLEPWGSHPLTDPLLSTATTKIRHYGGGFTRFEKVAYVARSEMALSALHVCFRSKSEKNCGECDKCLRTMLMLEVQGKLRECETFPDATDLARVARVYCSEQSQRRHFHELRELALANDRADIARAVGRSLRRTALIDKVQAVCRRLHAVPLIGALVRRLRDRLISRSVCAQPLIRSRTPGLPVHSLIHH